MEVGWAQLLLESHRSTSDPPCTAARRGQGSRTHEPALRPLRPRWPRLASSRASLGVQGWSSLLPRSVFSASGARPRGVTCSGSGGRAGRERERELEPSPGARSLRPLRAARRGCGRRPEPVKAGDGGYRVEVEHRSHQRQQEGNSEDREVQHGASAQEPRLSSAVRCSVPAWRHPRDRGVGRGARGICERIGRPGVVWVAVGVA